MKGKSWLLIFGEDGACFGEKFAFVDLRGGGNFGALGHGFDEFSHAG